MSGGSYGYLYRKETLVGHSGDLRAMAEDCLGYATREGTRVHDGEWRALTEDEKDQLRIIARYLSLKAEQLALIELRAEAMQEHMADLLKAVEWTASSDTCVDAILEAYAKMCEAK